MGKPTSYFNAVILNDQRRHPERSEGPLYFSLVCFDFSLVCFGFESVCYGFEGAGLQSRRLSSNSDRALARMERWAVALVVLASEIGPGFSPDIDQRTNTWALAPGICLQNGCPIHAASSHEWEDQPKHKKGTQ
jgi:hypothetical protein